MEYYSKDPIEPYFKLNNYAISKECITELLKIHYYDKKLNIFFKIILYILYKSGINTRFFK